MKYVFTRITWWNHSFHASYPTPAPFFYYYYYIFFFFNPLLKSALMRNRTRLDSEAVSCWCLCKNILDVTYFNYLPSVLTVTVRYDETDTGEFWSFITPFTARRMIYTVLWVLGHQLNISIYIIYFSVNMETSWCGTSSSSKGDY